MKGYETIGEYGQKVFNRVHQRHLDAMGENQKKNYTKDQVKGIKPNNQEGCLEVYFKNGEMFKYAPNGTWY